MNTRGVGNPRFIETFVYTRTALPSNILFQISIQSFPVESDPSDGAKLDLYELLRRY